MANDTCSQDGVRKGRAILTWVVVLSLLLTTCGGVAQDKSLTVGAIINVSIHSSVIEGFKAGMAELGYVEGENVTYIYNGLTEPNLQAIDGEIENLLAQDVDMLFTVGIPTTLAAKKAVMGTDTPVVFSAVVDPVGEGIVESIRQPGGNLTGVQVSGYGISRALEWLVTITPEAKKVYLPYNPDEKASIAALDRLDKAASQLGIELVLDKVYSVEEAVATIESLPEDVDAIFRVPSPTLDPRNDELSQAAIERGLPMGASLPLDEAVLVTLASDLFEMGKQAARLADQIRRGIKPADLPVETGEIYVAINLKTSEAIGLHIPNEILEQVDTIIR